MALQYKEYGDKKAPMMVFLHGGGVSGWMWDKQITHFKHYHCIVPDLPEQGLSNTHAPFSIEQSAKEINAFIEEEANGKKIIGIGFSLGAQVLIQMASINPKLMDYIMINSALVRPMPLAKKIIGPSIKSTFPLIKNKRFSRIQAKSLYIGDDHFDTYYQESIKMSSDTLIRIMEENMSFKIPPPFQETTGKILVTVGEKEKSIMKKSAFDIVKNHSGCQGVILEGIGHGAPLATPANFNKLIESWLSGEELAEEVKKMT